MALAAFLVAIAIANVAPSQTKTDLMKVDGPILTALGPKQIWSVFAPDPSRIVIDTVVRFRYTDGTTGSWRIAKRGPLLGAYRDYRWLKLGESSELPDAGAGLIDWTVRNHAAKPVREAALVRRVRPIAKPGRRAGDHLPFTDEVLFVARYGSSG